MVVPHLEQAPSLLQWVTENKSLDQNNEMIINDLVPDIAGQSTHPDIVLKNTAILLYDDELELSV